MTAARPPREDSQGRGQRSIAAERERQSTRPEPVVLQPWLERHASRLRWATGLAIVLIGIRLVAPRPDGWRRWSDATAALQDVESVRTAALLYYQSGSREWPPPGRFGQAPAGMLPYLPGGVSFGRARYRLAWEYAADSASGARIIGISVVGDDPRLALAIAQRSNSGMAFVVSGRRFTALIASAKFR